MTMPQEMQLTVHSQQRMKARSIRQETIDLILKYGKTWTSGECVRHQLTENVVEELEEYLYLPLPPDKLARVYVIVCQGIVVTAAHEDQSPPSYFSLGVRAHRQLIH